MCLISFFLFFFPHFLRSEGECGFKRLSTWMGLLVAAHFLAFKWFLLSLDVYIN